MTVVPTNTAESSRRTDSETEQLVARKPQGRQPKVPRALSTTAKPQ